MKTWEKWVPVLLAGLMILCFCCAGATESFYIVSYDGNGYTGTIDSQPKYPGQDLTLSDNYPNWKEHVFLGWASSPDATAAEYQPGDVYTKDEDITLYAVWMDAENLGSVGGTGVYTVEYPFSRRFAYITFSVQTSGQYAVRSTNSFYARVSGSTWIEYEQISSYGYSDGKTIYGDKVGEEFEFLADLEAGITYHLFYYHFGNPLQLEISNENIFHTVAYDGNGYTGKIDSQPKYPGKDLTLSNNYPDWKDHVFLGWASSPDATAAEYQPGDVYIKDESITLYAVWMDAENLGSVGGNGTYTVEYPVSRRFAYITFSVQTSGKYVVHSVNSFYAMGSGSTWIEYEQISSYGYSDRKTIYGNKVGNDFEFLADLEAGITYHLSYYLFGNPLQLEIIDDHSYYTISYDGNGYTGRMDSQPKYPGKDLTLSENYPNWKEHVFLGWASSPDATAAEYQPGDVYIKDESITLYAVWMDAKNLGTVKGSGTYTVEYPVSRRFAYITFSVKNSGKYVVHSVNSFYARVSGSTWIEYEQISSYGYSDWQTLYGNKVGNDFEFLADLEAGITYHLFYYHFGNPLELEIIHQYPGLNFQTDIKLPKDLQVIEDMAFAGNTFKKVEIPAQVQSVGMKAFADCTELEQVLVRGRDTEFDSTAFEGCETSLIIIAPEDSYAHRLAEERGFVFCELE